MATKTVINTATNMPQTTTTTTTQRGISIIIDQDQNLQRQQQLEASKITIYHQNTAATKVTKTTTAAAAATEKLQQLSPKKSSATLKTTFIDINRNNDNIVAYNEHEDHQHNAHHVEHGDDQRQTAKETGYTTLTTERSTNTKTTTFPQLLLRVAANEPDTITMARPTSERGKLTSPLTTGEVGSIATYDDDDDDSLIVLGKSQRNTKTYCAGMEPSLGIGIVHRHHGSNGTNGHNDVLASSSSSKKTIIQCNEKAEEEDNHQANNGHHNDHTTKYNEESSRRSLGRSLRSCNGIGGDSVKDDVDDDDDDDDDDEVTGENGQYVCESVGSTTANSQRQLAVENVWPAKSHDSRTTKAEDCASALTETQVGKSNTNNNNNNNNNASYDDSATSHVVKIQIKPNTVVVGGNANVQQHKLVENNDNILIWEKPKVSVVQLRDSVESEIQIQHQSQKESVSKTELHLNIVDKVMVQKPGLNSTSTSSSNSVAQNSGQNSGNHNHNNNNNNNNNNNILSGGTTVTELNVSNQSCLYYVMSSGQFSPCDTLDSGTGSDLESNAQTVNMPIPKNVAASNGSVGKVAGVNGNSNGSANGGAPKLELHLKTTKIRVSSNASKSSMDSKKQQQQQNNRSNSEHQRAGSLTDSEESESSSLSCDSLHSSEFMRQSSASPTDKSDTAPTADSQAKILASFLPDSLLRDIRDRKFPNNDFDEKYGSGGADEFVDASHHHQSLESVSEQDYVEEEEEKDFAQEAAEHVKFLQQLKSSNSYADKKRTAMPSKTFVLNAENGTFVDTKLNSMPRKYEADKFYNFHVNEHQNFRSFGHGGCNTRPDDTVSLSEFDTKSLHDDAFAGYKDIRCGSGSATNTIRSSKGTVRGVKNRVRNGIATFLQMQHPNVKNYKEKDLGKVVLYTTSMGIIRDTYAKCANMKQILRTLLVKFEERDVFMSVEYQQEIKERMHSEAIKVPQLFVEGQHIGDAETVERLNESGELRQLLKPYKSIASTYTCQTCGGYRLLPCPSCNGSKKSVHRNHFTAEFVALKCMNCDEVGLVKCHNC